MPHEFCVGLGRRSFVADFAECLLQRQPLLHHKVRDDQRGTPAHAVLTVHQYTAGRSSLPDKVRCLFEILFDVFRRRIHQIELEVFEVVGVADVELLAGHDDMCDVHQLEALQVAGGLVVADEQPVDDLVVVAVVDLFQFLLWRSGDFLPT